MQLFYQPEITSNASVVTFDKEESRHIVKVLRHKVGDKLMLTDGRGFFYNAEIISDDIKHCIVRILSCEEQPAMPFHLHIAVAPTKTNDRYEWFLEKATEIGVSEITPLICERSERTEVKLHRYEKVVVSAMKQSLRAYLPKLNQAISYKDFLAKTQNLSAQRFIAHCEKSPKVPLIQWFSSHSMPSEIIILIGPEGDFSVEEIRKAEQVQYQPISLSDSRLRTETAALVAVHIANVFSQVNLL